MLKKSPLSEIFGVGSLVEHYEQYIDKDWKEWLSFDQIFEKPGKQGLVGLLECKDKKIKNKIVFKISQYINYLVYHEFTVMKSLNELSPYCPHFCKAIGVISCQVDPKVNKTENPFNIKSKYPIEKEVLLMEYIDKSCKFYNYIRSDKIEEKILYSTIKQVLMAITIAQRKKQFSHYDLHSYNVMMKKCDKDVVFLYVLDEDNQFCVPTYGHYPVIIDFGFSYIKELDNGPCWPSLSHTDVGFMSDRFDWVADPKLFLVTVAYEIKKKRGSKMSKKFSRMVTNIFNNLSIEWDSGWDNTTKRGATDFVIEMLEGYNKDSYLFENFDDYCVDLLVSLVILPLQEQNYDNIGKSYKAFLKEFVKIENEIGNPFYNMYILKGIVDVARDVRSKYLIKSSRKEAVTYFRRGVYQRINYVSKFCRPKDIHFEKMLCSLYCLTKEMEGVFYDVIYTRMKEKTLQYEKMPLQSIEQIYGVVDINIPDEYKFNKNTTIFVLNCDTKTCDKFDMCDDKFDVCDNINKLHCFEKGSYLYEKYSSKLKKNKI